MKRRLAKRGPVGRTIVLKLDRGIAAYLHAYHLSLGLHFTEADAAVYMIRESLIRWTEKPHCLAMMLPHLPADIQAAWAHRFVPRKEPTP